MTEEILSSIIAYKTFIPLQLFVMLVSILGDLSFWREAILIFKFYCNKEYIIPERCFL